MPRDHQEHYSQKRKKVDSIEKISINSKLVHLNTICLCIISPPCHPETERHSIEKKSKIFFNHPIENTSRVCTYKLYFGGLFKLFFLELGILYFLFLLVFARRTKYLDASLFSHQAFTTSQWGAYFLAFWGVVSMVGSPYFGQPSIVNTINFQIPKAILTRFNTKDFFLSYLAFGITKLMWREGKSMTYLLIPCCNGPIEIISRLFYLGSDFLLYSILGRRFYIIFPQLLSEYFS